MRAELGTLGPTLSQTSGSAPTGTLSLMRGLRVTRLWRDPPTLYDYRLLVEGRYGGGMERQTPTAIDPREDTRPAPDPARTADDILSAAEDLVPLLRQRAAEADESRRIEADTYRRLREAGLFRILKPKKYGGPEHSQHD